ncbi:hypothetical protein SAMN05421538_1204 [Paracoccus isoporae]|uniref:Uncharacterized protein n=1 Tax=Paracoccus isoporae TaxID=591205 RepID=A0A1G7HDA4_9RHOB|nr:hypothetical protein [Paracoccus isoporae]SDE98351.1 hypothetical protein SAMN05421538_1204 [Paracoccus isoporae]
MRIPITNWRSKMDEKGKAQLDKFKEAARQLETDDDDERFEERLKQIVKQKPDDKKSSD